LLPLPLPPGKDLRIIFGILLRPDEVEQQIGQPALLFA
jgi:hypothetical protein